MLLAHFKNLTPYFLFSIFFILCPNPTLADEWKSLDNGLSYKKISQSKANAPIHFHVFKINPQILKIKPIVADQGLSVKSFAEKSKALVTINANFFDENGRPLGLVKTDRKVIQPKKDISWWAVLCFRNKSVTIIPAKNVEQGYCHQAIQAGPRLVINGHIPTLKENISQKTAVGINNKGELFMVVTKDRISIQTLAEIFKKSETQGGLGCPNALNLDGGSSSQLYAKTNDFELNLNSFMQVPVALGVFK